MTDQREQAKAFIRKNGPSLPVQLAKELKTEILFASAILSELTSRNELKLTSKPIGGSPLYYLPGQESRILEKLSPYIKGKEKEALDMLKEQKILREKGLEPWQRIAFRNLKDFAKPLSAEANEHKEIFWKYFLISNTEANDVISRILNEEAGHPEPVEKTPEPQPKEQQSPKSYPQETPEQQPAPEQQEAQPPKIPESSSIPQQQNEELMSELKQQIIKELKEQQATPAKKPRIKQQTQPGKFYNQIKDFFTKNNIKILKETAVRKEREYDFIAEIPSPIGILKYYIKAKDRKSVTEAELSSAYAEGKIQQLPPILLSTGIPNKKTQNLLNTKFSGRVIFKKI